MRIAFGQPLNDNLPAIIVCKREIRIDASYEPGRGGYPGFYGAVREGRWIYAKRHGEINTHKESQDHPYCDVSAAVSYAILIISPRSNN